MCDKAFTGHICSDGGLLLLPCLAAGRNALDLSQLPGYLEEDAIGPDDSARRAVTSDRLYADVHAREPDESRQFIRPRGVPDRTYPPGTPIESPEL
jgi:hypothetical protein